MKMNIIRRRVYVQCPDCMGYGWTRAIDYDTGQYYKCQCGRCGGRGRVADEPTLVRKDWDEDETSTNFG